MMSRSHQQRLSDLDYRRLRDLIRQRSGLEFPELRRPDLEQAVLRVLEQGGLRDSDALYAQLVAPQGGDDAFDALIASLTVGETHFFRNRPQFDALERRILPDLIARRREARCLRLWSAGCATGEEPYSLAILLHRLLPDIADWNILLLATEINRKALEKAQRGLYGRWSLREVPPDIQEQYFHPHGRAFELAPEIRRQVRFAYLNLAEASYPSPATQTTGIDLILCRNVTIYFAEDTTRAVVARLHDALANGGWLVVGHAEPSQSIFHRFQPRNFPGAVVYQKQPAKQDSPQRFAPDGLETSAAPRRTSLPLVPSMRTSMLEQVGQSAPDTDGREAYLEAKACADRHELEAAERWLNIVLSRAPLFAPAHYLRALILQETGRLEEAMAALRRAVYADPEFVLAHFALAGLLGRLGQGERAEKSFDNVSRLLAGRERDELIPEGDGLSVGRLLELAALQREHGRA